MVHYTSSIVRTRTTSATLRRQQTIKKWPNKLTITASATIEGQLAQWGRGRVQAATQGLVYDTRAACWYLHALLHALPRILVRPHLLLSAPFDLEFSIWTCKRENSKMPPNTLIICSDTVCYFSSFPLLGPASWKTFDKCGFNLSTEYIKISKANSFWCPGQNASVTPISSLSLSARGFVVGEVGFGEATVRGNEVDSWEKRSKILKCPRVIRSSRLKCAHVYCQLVY